MKFQRYLLVTLFIALLWFSSAQTILAAELITEVSPAKDSMVEQSPKQIAITFGEPIEDALYSIKVENEARDLLTEKQAYLSEDQLQLLLDLPEHLEDGTYKVSYRAVTTEGHAVQSAYVFGIGEQPGGVLLDEVRALIEQEKALEEAYLTSKQSFATDESHHEELPTHERTEHNHDMSETSFEEGEPLQLGAMDILQFLSNALYYLSMLSLIGWVCWQSFQPLSRSLEARREKGNLVLTRAFLICFIAMAAFHLPDYIDPHRGFDWQEFMSLTIARSWVAQLILAFLAFIMLKGTATLRILWVCLLLVANMVTGQSFHTDPAWLGMLLHVLHMLAGAFWLGGLAYIFIAGKAVTLSDARFLKRFSWVTWLSFFALVLSGVLMTWSILPSLRYLAMTSWGTVLIIKLILTLGALLAVFFARRAMSKQGVSTYKIFRFELSSLILIILVTSILSMANPLPEKQPFYWHVMGDEIHMTAQVSSTLAGENTFLVKVWLPDQLTEPEHVQLELIPKDVKKRNDVISIPLQTTHDPNEQDFFRGFKRYDFTSTNKLLNAPGTWMIKITVVDPLEQQFVFEKEWLVR